MGFFDRVSRIRSLSTSSKEVCLRSSDRFADTVRFVVRRIHCLLLAIRDRIVDEELVQFLSVAFRFDNPPLGGLGRGERSEGRVLLVQGEPSGDSPVAACGEAIKPGLAPIGSLSMLGSIDTVAAHFLAKGRTMQTQLGCRRSSIVRQTLEHFF
jgi:hypothetical protein